ncbi:MAG: hypothetical protein PHP23_06765 [Desulfobacterales bacterium]|nr:hypothetical protein [Desulfobacterales bacterium]MDD4073232.1 hypothetical protein [Desulfobacterales bacterium]MDD4393611.1 hypothetical protein [Desulfobacterales bacterium]
MKENKSSGFNIDLDLDDDTPASLFKTDTAEVQLKKLRGRFVLAAVLIPCIIIGILAAAYVDLHRKFISLQDKGESGVQNLNQNLESRFSSLSVKLATLEESITTKLPGIEKNSEALKKTLTAVRKDIDALASSKSDRTELKQAVSDINQSIKDSQQQLAALPATIKALERQVATDMTDFGKTVDSATQAISDLKTDINTLSSGKISRQQLSSEIEKQQEAVQKQLQNISGKFNSALKEMKGRLDELQKLADANKKASNARAGVLSGPQSTPRAPAPDVSPAGSDKKADAVRKVLPQPGVIVEQNIE